MPLTTKDELRSAVLGFLSERSNGNGKLSQLDDSQNLFETGQIDSIGFLELLLFLSEQTGREFDLADTDLSQLAVMGQLLDYFVESSTSS